MKKLSEGMSRVESVTGGVAPSPHAGIGLSVIRAITGYSGKPVQLMRDGKVATAYALTESMRYTIAPPGRLPLRNIRFSLIDVPDLTMLAQLRPELRTGRRPRDLLRVGTLPGPRVPS